jgi:tetratricopeptide (TPR) repeat protein
MIQALQEYRLALEAGSIPNRADFLAGYPDIAEELAACLDALEFVRRAGSQIQSSAALVAEPREDLKPEGPLGDFRLVREIGRGGMGVVYEAVQISLGRRVALKVLPLAAALDAKQLQRFKNEAQAAAHLQHQNIVPVHFVGCERGVHFYAMQYIDGHTLADLIQDLRCRGRSDEKAPNCEARRSRGPSGPEAAKSDETPVGLRASTFDLYSSVLLGLNLSFFRIAAHLVWQAAVALEHAHQLGIVHRDIKPANLLVDGRGNLWVTDFGLAHCQSQAGLTLSGDLLGTMRYMSPEQALGKRLLLDHRTDLYSLGATFYELLILQPAFDGRDRQELMQQIATDDPKPPRQVSKAVPAELETIVLKAMAKSPEERYATCQELADDLQRFLKDEPIRARRPTRVQRARRWARRHQAVVWSVAVGLLATLVALTGSAGWVVRDRAARQARTITELQATLEEAQRLQQQGKWAEGRAVARRAETLLAGARGGAELRQRVYELLADLHMVAKLEEVRLLRSAVKDGFFDAVGEARGYADAFREYGIDVETLDPRAAAERIRARTICVELAAALDGWAEARRGVPAKGGQSRRDLLAIARAADRDPWRASLRDAVLRGDRQAVVSLAASEEVLTQSPATIILVADSLGRMGQRPEATALLRRAQGQQPGDFRINHTLADYLATPATPCWGEAVTFYTAAVALRPDSPGARLNLGVALLGQGRLNDALAAFHKAIELKPDYAEAHCNVGSVLDDQGRFDEALAALRKAIELKPQLAEAHFNLGLTYQKQGHLDEAVAAYRRTIALRPGYAEAHNILGRVLLRKGRLDEAVAAWRQALALKPDLPEAHFNLGLALLNRGRLDEAVAAYRRATDLKPSDAEAHCNLGVALDHQGRLDEAIQAYRRAIRLKPDLVTAHANLGRTLERQGRLHEAVAAYHRAIALNSDNADTHYNLGNALRDLGQLTEAVAAYRRAAELRPAWAEAYCNLGLTLRQQGNFAEALAAVKRGHEFGSRRPDWPYLSARWVRECRQLSELQSRLPAFVRGEAQPANAAERNTYALFCYDQKRYVVAARLWARTVTSDPQRASDLETGCGYDAACAAALAVAGRGADADQLDDKERAHWRKQALGWLRADLESYGNQLGTAKPIDRQRVLQRLQDWQVDQALAGLRDPVVVAKLPADEQEACKQFWAEVQALLSQSAH